MEAVEKIQEAEAPKPKKVKTELDYIANNNTFVVKAENGKTVTVEVNGEKWGEAVAVENVATVVLKRELPETYTYKIK
jgi:hypothetical protein